VASSKLKMVIAGTASVALVGVMIGSSTPSGAVGTAPAAQNGPTAAVLKLIQPSYTATLTTAVVVRPYALCAASGVVPTKTTTSINGVSYHVGVAICPIVTGKTVINTSLQGTAETPAGRGTIWSSFGQPSTFPQLDGGTWTVAPATPRNYVVSPKIGKSESNLWGYPCVTIKPVNIGGKEYPLAECAGPMMENITNEPVRYGSAAYTQAAPNLPNPVGYAYPYVLTLLKLLGA